MYAACFVVFILSSCSGRVINTFAVSDAFEEIYPTAEEKLVLEDKNHWWRIGTEQLLRNILLENDRNQHVAKNVILFIGDGMGISTISGARIYKGQRSLKQSGEDYKQVYEDFPNVALAKTYNVDKQVPDSGGSGTALFTGVKTRYQAIGVDATSHTDHYDEAIHKNAKLEGFMTWAQNAGKYTGIISTTALTDATPAGTYAQTYIRYIQCDTEVKDEYKGLIKDVARQLIEDAPGKNFRVMLGGGQEYLGFRGGENCNRSDGLNLTEIWLTKHANAKAVLASTTGGLQAVNDDTEYLLGTFAGRHMPYELLRDKSPAGSPSLPEMTKNALKVLKKSPKGFVLMVESGLIDKAHHDNYARMALEESSQLEEAVRIALNETGPDTLIIVTADHSHSFTFNGYPARGNDILGYTIDDEEVGILYPVVSYANGPAFYYHYLPNDTDSPLHPWRSFHDDPNRLRDPLYRQPATWGLSFETHGGEDVAVFATGPNSHLIRGVIEQNYVAHVISYSACIGPHAKLNSYCSYVVKCDASASLGSLVIKLLTIVFLYCLR